MDIFRHVVKNKWQEVIKATIQQISSLLNLLRMIVNKNAKTFSGILFLFKRVTIKIPISTWIKKKSRETPFTMSAYMYVYMYSNYLHVLIYTYTGYIYGFFPACPS